MVLLMIYWKVSVLEKEAVGFRGILCRKKN
jgi:hypothetical protein